ncbi:hypothetical protein DFH29DRAFT_892575 [Suillus ampliporus]|nr:hypothetical protein DFH29DRAFT_892575 [Suillus ampliporus]
MLNVSLKENIIIAQGTGSGKTLIAILRMRYEIERGSQKVSWFLAPTVVLCEQQHRVIEDSMQVPVGLIHGALEPKQWTDISLWKRVLENNRVIVSTPRHGYVHMGLDIGLLVFDEAHHADRNHPMSCIMQGFYFSLAPRLPAASGLSGPTREEHLMILGLTPNPMFGGNATQILEVNLDCVIRSPRANGDELLTHVHPPVFRHVCYDILQLLVPNLTSKSLSAVRAEDPFVIQLHGTLSKTSRGQEYTRLNQKLHSHSGMSDPASAAAVICDDIGPWAADWPYIESVVSRARDNQTPYDASTESLQGKEKTYLIKYLSQIELTPLSLDPVHIEAGITDKVRVLLYTLEYEKEWSESANEPHSGLISVTLRDGVLALAEVLRKHPCSAPHFRLGCLLGNSQSSYRKIFLDITRTFLKESQSEILEDFWSGDRNLIIPTSVTEEGLDIQACGNVIRWDIPDNMASWAQSRGRARRRRSSFVLMFKSAGIDNARVVEFENLERQMTALYQADRASRPPASTDDEEPDGEQPVFKVKSTGATLTPQQAVTHINHFCAVYPNSGHNAYLPIYDIDPLDIPEGWHSFDPGNASIPRNIRDHSALPAELRIFIQPAHRNVAFKAYLALYDANLLNDHLLPLTSVEVRNLLKDVEKRSGMTSVTSQMNPWQDEEADAVWRATRIVIQFDLPSSAAGEAAVLYHPYKGRINVELQTQGVARHTISDVQWDKLDFAYIFEPAEEDPEREVWDARRRWLRDLQGEESHGDDLFANVDCFLGWRHDPLSEEEYTKTPDFEVTYPFLHVEKLPRRVNFLLPPASTSESSLRYSFLLPQSSRIVFLSQVQCDHATVIPSIIRHISTLSTETPLYNIPFPLLITAVTAPVAEAHTLGDAVLKFVVPMHLLATYPLYSEGYLTSGKDHAIVRDRFTPRKFGEDAVTGDSSRGTRKLLADVVETLIGAAYVHGGLDLGIECTRIFGLGIDRDAWQSLEVYIDKALSYVETAEAPTQDVEPMLGYTFTRKLLLVEAITHASYQFDLRTVSYERMEFLGDSVLDMLWRVHIRKSAMVNTHFLAYICFQCPLEKDASLPRPSRSGIVMDEETQWIYLYKCLQHSNQAFLDQQRETLARYRKVKDEIEEALLHGTTFPWAALIRPQAPKFLSDMIESIIGARILKVDVDVDIEHPLTRLNIWASREHEELTFSFEEERGRVICTITMEGRELVQATAEKRGRASQGEKAMQLWEVRATDRIKDA